MSFIDKIKGFIEVSRVGKLFGTIVYIVRQQLDTDGDGVVEADEILKAIPANVLGFFLPAVVTKWLPTIIEIIIDFQKSAKNK
jgi:hypothetical protein